MIKSRSGGGGRGMREVIDPADLGAAVALCAAEADAASGDRSLFGEQLVRGARHIEVQLIGDGVRVVSLGDRDCSVQRRHQKLIEISPAQSLADEMRADLHRHAVALGRSVGLRGLATVEFLVRADECYFLEVNPRLQVEHTVTEAVTGLDLVALQFALAGGAALDELDLGARDVPEPAGRGIAIQARVNAERVDADGLPRAVAGRVTALTFPTGPGVRVDTAARPGIVIGPHYDPLLAKVVVHAHGPDFGAAAAKLERALREVTVTGIDTNRDHLLAIVADPEFRRGGVDTGYLARRGASLAAGMPARISAVPGAPGRRGRGHDPRTDGRNRRGDRPGRRGVPRRRHGGPGRGDEDAASGGGAVRAATDRDPGGRGRCRRSGYAARHV